MQRLVLVDNQEKELDDKEHIREELNNKDEHIDLNLDPDDLIIKSFTPLGFSINSSEFVGTVGTLSLLCVSKSDKIFTMCTNYLFENELELEIVKDGLEFYDESTFISNKFVSNILLTHINSFITDFSFTYNKDIDNDEKFDFKAKFVHQKEGLQPDIYTFSVTSDIYASMKFIDQYIFSSIINKHDIGISTVHGYNIREKATDVIIVDRIDRVISLAPMNNDKNNINYAIEFVVKDINNNSNTILSTFNLGQTFNKKKFKGMTIEKLEANYLVESDQYIQGFLTFDKFKNIDKEYLIIVAENKDNEYKIFLLDSTIRTELETMVGDY